MKSFLDEDALNLNHVGPTPWGAALAQRLAGLVPAPLEVCLFANGGAEGVEAAMKLATAATGRARFVACANGYHGTGIGPLALMGQARPRAPFEALLPRAEIIPFGDESALERALAKRDAAAFVVEPIQGEGGVVLAPDGYLAKAKELCGRYGTLLVLDEVQTGLGRTGTMFALEHEGVVPDVLVLGKALGGGLAPISAAVTTKALQEKAYGTTEAFDLHGSTFGGNAFACAAALETLDIVRDEKLAERSARLGARLLGRLREGLAGHPLVKEVRGRGLLVAVELGATDRSWLSRQAPQLVDAVSQRLLGQWICLEMLEKGYLLQPAALRWEVLRLEPPLTIEETELDAATDALIETLRDHEGLARLALRSGARLAAQAISRGSFR